MSDKPSQAEKISQLMDGDADHSLDWLWNDQTAAACWRRFHMIRDVLRDCHSSHLCNEFNNRVMQALENEPTVINPRSLNRRKLFNRQQILKPVAGFAIAATVATVTVLGFQSIYQNQEAPMLVANSDVNQRSGQVAVSQTMLVPASIEKNQPRVVDNSIDGYLLEHMEQSDSAQVQGMLPYVRLAGYDN